MSTHPPDAGSRWEWLLAVVWLVFLGFPLMALLKADLDPIWRGVGITLVALFAWAYARGIYRIDHHRENYRMAGDGWAHLAVMLLVLAPVAALIGDEAIGMLPFVVCLALLTLPVAWGVSIWVGCIAIAVAVPIWQGDLVPIFLAGIIALVGGTVLLIRRSEQREEERQALVEDYQLAHERERVARDVHDVLGHSLTVIALKLELAERLIDVDPDRAKIELAQAHWAARESLTEVRSTVTGLRIIRLEEERSRCRALLADAGIALTEDGEPVLSDSQRQVALAWALRELVTNVVRHSRATQCRVRWSATGLEVTDNGIGLRTGREGSGIRGIRERAAALGGDLVVAGREGGGTTMVVRL